jgi:hypothetical protein
MTTKTVALELLKKMQNANPHIKKSKEEGISSALVAIDYIIEESRSHIRAICIKIYL